MNDTNRTKKQGVFVFLFNSDPYNFLKYPPVIIEDYYFNYRRFGFYMKMPISMDEMYITF